MQLKRHTNIYLRNPFFLKKIELILLQYLPVKDIIKKNQMMMSILETCFV